MEGGGFNHLVIAVEDVRATVGRLTDPDGYRIELVQWPPGHPEGVTARDLGDRRSTAS